MGALPLVTKSPAWFTDGSASPGIAAYAIARLFEQKPDLPGLIYRRHATLIAFELDDLRVDEDDPNSIPIDALLRTQLSAVEARFALHPDVTATPLYVGGGLARHAYKLRALKHQPSRGHYLGTCGGGEGGVIFVSNIDDTVLPSESWTRAEQFIQCALDQLVGPGLV